MLQNHQQVYLKNAQNTLTDKSICNTFSFIIRKFISCTYSLVSLFRNFVTVRPALEKALSDRAEEAGTKVCLPIRGMRQCDYHYKS